MIDEYINKIICGDAYELIKKIPDKSIDMIYTDIPYLYTIGGTGHSEISVRTERKKRELAEISDGIDYSIFEDFIRVSKRLNCYIWCSRLQVPDILNFFVPRGYLFDILVWAKTNPMPTFSNIFMQDIEYCLYFRERGVKLNSGYELKSKWFLSQINAADKKLFAHPTIKPLKYVVRHILHTSQEGEIIFDPFIGSGTTAAAAAANGRRYIGFEKDKRWHKIAVDRLGGIQADGQMSMFIR